MTKQEIMTVLKEDYNGFAEYGLEIFGVFLYGSQNYQLYRESSDIDTKLVYIPERSNPEGMLTCLGEIFLRDNKCPGKVVIISLQDFLKELEECEPAFFEILYTQYCIIGAPYKEYWRLLQQKREQIVYQDIIKALEMIQTNILQTISSEEAYYTDQIHNNKKLALFYRFLYMSKAMCEGKNYQDCLVLPDGEERAYIQFLREEAPLSIEEGCIAAGKVMGKISNLIVETVKTCPKTNYEALKQIKEKFGELYGQQDD